MGKSILLRRETSGTVVVKLGDLHHATKAKAGKHGKDMTDYGMTVFCMSTGEKFDAKKFRPELIDELVATVADLTNSVGNDDLPCAAAAAEGTGMGKSREQNALGELPGLLQSIWHNSRTMSDVRDLHWLQGWAITEDVEEAAGT